MNNLNSALKDLGFSKVKMPYATDQKPLDEMERLAEIERRLDIEPEAEEQEADEAEAYQDADQEADDHEIDE